MLQFLRASSSSRVRSPRGLATTHRVITSPPSNALGQLFLWALRLLGQRFSESWPVSWHVPHAVYRAHPRQKLICEQSCLLVGLDSNLFAAVKTNNRAQKAFPHPVQVVVVMQLESRCAVPQELIGQAPHNIDGCGCSRSIGEVGHRFLYSAALFSPLPQLSSQLHLHVQDPCAACALHRSSPGRRAGARRVPHQTWFAAGTFLNSAISPPDLCI